MRTILCVDPHHERLRALAAILQSRGYACIVVQELDKAERNVAANHVDLIVVFRGNWAGQRLKKIRNVPVLVVHEEMEMSKVPHTENVVVYNPEAPELLLQAVKKLLDAHEDGSVEIGLQ